MVRSWSTYPNTGLAISGYDPVEVARHIGAGPSAVLVGDRRAALRIIARATRRWPEVARTIAP